MEAKKAAGYYRAGRRADGDDALQGAPSAATSRSSDRRPYAADMPNRPKRSAQLAADAARPSASARTSMLRLGARAASCAHFTRRSRRGSRGCADLRARDDPRELSRRSTCRSTRAGGISSPAASTAGRRSTAARSWPTPAAQGARGLRSRHRQRAARRRRRARLALSRRRRAAQSVAPLRGAGARQLRHVRRRRFLRPTRAIRCAPMPTALAALDAAALGERLPGQRRTIRWSGSKAAPRCCAGSASGRWPTRTSSAG